MIKKTILISGSSAVGKTSILRHLIPILEKYSKTCICKIDCIHTEDKIIFDKLGIPCVVGISEDICPDHYLASNMEELIDWGSNLNCNILLIETAGLCHRCCPATEKTINICVVDSTGSSKTPGKLGPMIYTADIIVLSKIDLISQAEKEILMYSLKNINVSAMICPVDSLSGYGAEFIARKIQSTPSVENFIGDRLRSSMPAGVCSYCIGEQRIGNRFQQGVVKKIKLEV